MWSDSDRIIYLPPAEVDPEFELPAVLGINRTWRPLSVARIAFGCKIEGRVEGVEKKGNPQAVGELTKSTSRHNIFKL